MRGSSSLFMPSRPLYFREGLFYSVLQCSRTTHRDQARFRLSVLSSLVEAALSFDPETSVCTGDNAAEQSLGLLEEPGLI